MKGKYWSRTFYKCRVSCLQLNAGISFGASIDVMWEDVIMANVSFLFWSLTLEVWIRKYGEDAIKVKIDWEALGRLK